MSKTRVRVKLDVREELKGVFDERFINRLGGTTIEGMLKAVRSGLSPVKGYGRFIGYKAQREGNRSGYPYNQKSKYPGKTVRPVNLTLSGSMLKSIDYKGVPGENKIELGYFTESLDKKKAETHNEGTQANVPQRKFLPTGEGEEFIVSIQRSILDVVRERLFNIIKKSNKK